MSSFRRKPRPLSREEQTYRDDTLLVVACEDRYAPAQYFSFLPNERVKILPLPTLDTRSNPTDILNRLLTFQQEHDLKEFDQLWLALDRDHWAAGSHRKALAEVCKECQQRGIEIAMSSPCFDLWLLLHQRDITHHNAPMNAAEVAKMFRETVGEFNKKRLRQEHYSPQSIRDALDRARALDIEPENWFPESPCTRIYRIVEQAVEKDFIRLRE